MIERKDGADTERRWMEDARCAVEANRKTVAEAEVASVGVLSAW